MPTKTLSVTMANYNHSAHLEIALKAICTQSLPPDEVLVVDDASTDNSVEIIQNIAAQFPFVHLIRNSVNQGPSASQNKALNMVTGEYLYIASADDLILPGFFEKSIALLKKFPQASLSCADSREINIETNDTHDHSRKWLSTPGYLSPKELAYINHNGEQCAIGSTDTIFRRSLLPAPIFHNELERFTDWFLCETLAFRYGCCYTPETLAVVHTKKGSYSSPTNEDEAHYQQLCTKVFEKLLSQQYSSILSLVLYSRCLRVIRVSARTPKTIAKLLFSLHKNWTALKLLTYLMIEYCRDRFENLSQPSNILKFKCKLIGIYRETIWAVKRPLQILHDLTVTPLYWLQNCWQRLYAKSFHQYNRLRNFLRDKFRTNVH
jgi:glycosyltransferase involved in cell wall biosynthesis